MSAVFALCDGTRSRSEMASLASERVGQPVSDEMLHEALAQLDACHLLAPGSHIDVGMSRRQVVRKAALVGVGAAVAGPVIKSIVAPTPAMAASGNQCAHENESCQQLSDCCDECRSGLELVCFDGKCHCFT